MVGNHFSSIILIITDNMKRIFLTFAMLLLVALSWGKGIARPKLVVGIMVDQMRWDYLYYYNEKYGDDGLKRLLSEGFSCENTMITHVPTVTAIGHSSVYTGSVPAFTGIAGNNFFLNGKNVTSVTDTTVHAVGSDISHRAGQCSPRNLIANTIGDQLKIATDFKAKVIGVALKDRASILPAGHAADAAYWWDSKAGHFITSSYYMDKLPSWMETFNKANHTAPDFDIRNNPDGITVTFKLAEEVLAKEQMGKDDVTDLLAISISSTDAIGHATGTRGKENWAAYKELDKCIGKFLRVLDQKVGHGNYLLFLTADHGAVHNGNFMNEHKLPGGGWDYKPTSTMLEEGLSKKFGSVGKYVKAMMDCRIYLDHDLIAQNGLDFAAVKQEAMNILRSDHQFVYVVDYENVNATTIPFFLRERIINGYNRERSGDIMVVLKGSHQHGRVSKDYVGTSHGTWNPDDSHIPLVFLGWNVRQGSTSTPTRMVDIAATVCAMLHIQMPDCCIGDAIQEVWK